MYRRHVAAVHPPEEASLCLRWGCIQEQPTATSIPLIPFSFSPFFPPLPLLLFSFLFVRWYWISFFRKFDFAKGLIQTNEIYMINKIEDSKFSKNFQSFVPHYSILFFPPSSQRFNLRNNVQTNFSTTQPAKFTRWLRIIFASENICFCVNVSLDVRLSRTLEERSSLFRARAR